MNIILKNKLPKNVQLSPDIKDRAEAYIEIMMHGSKFYVPVTKELKKIVKISKRGNKYLFPTYVLEKRLDHFLRDFLQIMYLQIREEVGSEIHSSLSQELSEGFKGLFSNYLANRIDKGFEQKQLGFNKKE